MIEKPDPPSAEHAAEIIAGGLRRLIAPEDRMEIPKGAVMLRNGIAEALRYLKEEVK